MNENSGFSLDLSNTSIILSVHSVGYSPFEVYSEIFSYVAGIYANNIDFFTVTRFGYRKINTCFVKELRDIGEYFENKYYDIEEPISGLDIANITRICKLSDGEKNVNLGCIIEQGIIKDERYYKVTLDTDIFSNNTKMINKILFDKDELIGINDTLFRVYCGVITEKFATILLSEEDDIPEGLIGVENNE